MTKRKSGVLAGAGLLTATILWGGGFVEVKTSLFFLPPFYLIALRFTLAGLFLSAIFFPKLKLIKKTTLKTGAALAVFLFLAYAFQTVGLIYTTAGKNAFLTTVYVILVPFIGWFFSKEKPRWRIVIAAFIAIIGIGLLSLDGNFSVNIGDALTLICGFWFAVHIVFIARFTQKQGEDPIALTILQMCFCALLSWITAPFYDGAFPLSAFGEARPIFSLIYLAVFSSGAAFLLQNIGQKYTAPTTAALLLSLESLFGALFSALFLGETMSPRMLIGCALLFFAIVLSQLGTSSTHSGFRRKNILKRR